MITIQKKNEERIPLFELDGKVYTIPAEVPAKLMIRTMRTMTEKGEQAAGFQLLEDLLGQEAFDALSESDDVTIKELELIMLAAMEHMTGGIESGGKGTETS